jgi:dTDP-4-amino-4,6-dideoxygalactose transaminase
MEVINDRVNQRRKNNQRYRDFFEGVDGITFQTEPNTEYFSNYWLTAILVDSDKTGGITREDIRIALEKENIECRPLWKPMHMQPIYSKSIFFGSGICEKLFEQGLCLPSGSNLSDEEFGRIFSVLSIIFKK